VLSGHQRRQAPHNCRASHTCNDHHAADHEGRPSVGPTVPLRVQHNEVCGVAKKRRLAPGPDDC